jgi:DNA-binding transcriptional ArsR family regulator
MTIPRIIDTQRAALLPTGVRNVSLTSYAGALRARGFDAADILQALREENRERCTPPLPDWEVCNIAKSAAKWKEHPSRRGGEWRAASIPRGCFDPRPGICGFDASAIVEADLSLGLWPNHKTLYWFLVGLFGPWGCHPALRTIGERLGMPHQHVERHIKRLERAALILTAAGAYRRTERKFSARSYHFRRHWLFSKHFTRQGLPVFNDLEGFCHHLDEQKFSTGHQKISSPINQDVTEILSRFSGDVVPISQRGGSFDFETTGFFRACFGPDKGRMIHYASIVQYSECVSGCGGCRIVYSDGTVKRYECSCEVEQAAEVAA